MRTRILLLTILAVGVASCSPSQPAATTLDPTVPTTMTPTPTTSLQITTTSTVTPTAAPGTTTPQSIDVYFEGGQVVGPERFHYQLGDEVEIWIFSDVDDMVHVHGYDEFSTLTAGVPLQVGFEASILGVFEVELENSHTPLFFLEVTS